VVQILCCTTYLGTDKLCVQCHSLRGKLVRDTKPTISLIITILHGMLVSVQYKCPIFIFSKNEVLFLLIHSLLSFDWGKNPRQLQMNNCAWKMKASRSQCLFYLKWIVLTQKIEIVGAVLDLGTSKSAQPIQPNFAFRAGFTVLISW
jgi:hypothetical protein